MCTQEVASRSRFYETQVRSMMKIKRKARVTLRLRGSVMFLSLIQVSLNRYVHNSMSPFKLVRVVLITWILWLPFVGESQS
jgi:hypothetical protein